MVAASRWQRQKAGRLLLTAALAVLAAVPAASQNASSSDAVTTGTAYMSIENYPLPSDFKWVCTPWLDVQSGLSCCSSCGCEQMQKGATLCSLVASSVGSTDCRVCVS